ncbi:unnamed protein product [Sphagnum troendelagicum]|jgi:hypothetical protein|uniref:Photosystem II protein N n=3 Tax=Sphagnum TaxID=13804 RepID=A0ABP0UCE9_9BRYO|nr:hypothetical protein BDL97_02G200500 [Sphagnum fallax]KAH9573321.1 hypothetical protein CY35_02G200500 [Sphagnum magellanicum]
MAKVADILYKGVTAGLGVATLWFGANLAFNITRGISWHYAHDQETERKEETTQKS